MEKQTRSAELKRKRRYWKKHIVSWRKSGLGQRPYCRQHGLKFHQFVYWRKKYHPHNKAAVSLVQVALPGKPVNHLTLSPKPVHLITKTGYRIEVERDFDPAALKQLLHALERR